MAALGFVGLGIMGKPMAEHLLAGGHTLHVYNLLPEPMQELAKKGAVACSSCKEVASNSDIIIVMVPDTPDVETVLFSKDGLCGGLKKGSIVVDMSSISPIATKEYAHRLCKLGVKMLDAPVSGGQVGAEQATLSIMVGGDKNVFDKVKPILELMGKKITHVGGNGDGQTCKVANQIVVAGTLQTISEALLFAAKAGADPARVREALLGGFAQSRILELHGERIIKRNFKPGFRIKLQQKDLNNALQSARSLGLSLPATALAQELYNSVSAHDGADLDHSALVLALEQLANFQVAKG
jgi:2-hydroxy-3-oxopropionate reductase